MSPAAGRTVGAVLLVDRCLLVKQLVAVCCYPLVMTDVANWKMIHYIHLYTGFSHYKWGFPTAMLNY